MPNISKIKVNNEIYDIKDSLSRQQGYTRVVCEWDGNTEGLETKQLGYYTYYKVGDAIELAQEEYLAAPSASAYGAFTMMNSDASIELMMIAMVAKTFDSLNIYTDGISYKNNYAALFKSLEESAANAGLDFSQISEKGECFGFSYLGIMGAMGMGGLPGLMPHYINTAENLVLSKDLISALYGLDEEVVFTPGLWLVKVDVGEMVGYKTYPIWPELLYIPNEESTKLMDFNLKKLALLDDSGAFYVYNTSNNSVGANNYYSTTLPSLNDSPSSPSQQNNFYKDQKVCFWAYVQTGYKLVRVDVTGRTSGAVYETTPVEQRNSNYYVCSLYMPEEDITANYVFEAVS